MKIRIIFATLAISAMAFVPAFAQEETRQEIGISYGAVPNSVWIDVLSDVIPAIFGEKADNKGYVGPIGLEYYYHTSPLVGEEAAGAAVTALHLVK